MYPFQLPPHDEPHIPPTRLQVQEQYLREQKLLHGHQMLPMHQPVVPLVINAVRVRMGKLLVAFGTVLTGSRTAGANGPALAARR